MKAAITTTLMAVLLFAAQSASARVIWDWEITNPYNEVVQGTTVVMNARLNVSEESTEAFAWNGRYGWGYMNPWPLLRAFHVSLGPSGRGSLVDQFRGVVIAPGESFDFVFGVLTPKKALNRPGEYISPWQHLYLSGLGRRHNNYFQVDVPEPAAWALLAAGLLMAPVVLSVRRRRREQGIAA